MSRKTKPFWICFGAAVVLLALGAYLRTSRTHVREVKGLFLDDKYVVMCTIVNPSDQDAHIVAIVSALDAVESDDGPSVTRLARSEHPLVIPAHGERQLEVEFDASSHRHWAVRPEVILRSRS